MGNNNRYRPIGYWMLLGIAAIYIQIILGGITRLTGSGLSITEWKPIMGVIPPLNQAQWQEAFEKYKHIPQYEVLNRDMTLAGFKSIFFWEWFHRLWARVAVGLIFVVGLLRFLWLRKIDGFLIKRLLILCALGGLEGLMGWKMVQTGLKDNIWVSPQMLTVHLLISIVVISFMLWVALEYVLPEADRPRDKTTRRFSRVMLALIVVQIAYGGIMAGLKAALAFNTWPLFGMQWIPDFDTTHNMLYNAVNDKAMVQLIHRSLAYIIGLVSLVYAWLGRQHADEGVKHLFIFYPLIILVQITLGVLILINTPTDNQSMPIPVIYGVLHQATGVFTFLYTLFIYYQYRPVKSIQGVVL